MRAAAILALLAGCSSGEQYPLDGVLRFDHLQAIGTHNSYHREPASPFDDSHRYTHPPLEVQLGELGVRQLELDLHLTAGGWFEVFHLPGGVDSETTCLKFVRCLEAIKSWSDAHPAHVPVLIWLEPKDEELDWADSRYQPIADRYAELEAEILSVWPRDRILTPDEVRGAHATLPEAIETDGWPVLGKLRGRVVFSMLDDENHRARYLAPAANLAGRLMFVDTSSASDPFAALFKINDARADGAWIGELVRRGFVVTSNADSVGESDASNAARLDASFSAGAHFSSSDFVAPSAGYQARIPGGVPVRCHPLTAPAECEPSDLEK